MSHIETNPWRYIAVGLTILFAISWPVRAAGVEVLFDRTSPERTPFPSNLFTVADATQNTGRRVTLPHPDCSIRVSDCRDVDILNGLDGFNVRARLSIPFSGPIDPFTVTSASVFLIHMGTGGVVGINNILWDVETSTLHVKPNDALEQQTSYAFVVTDAVRDTAGKTLETRAFQQFRRELNFGQTHDDDLKEYRAWLLEALDLAEEAGVPPARVAAASVFTTQSITSLMVKIRDQIKAATPPPADFMFGGVRAVFPLSAIANTVYTRQVEVGASGAPLFGTPSVSVFTEPSLGTLALGRFVSPEYRRSSDRTMRGFGGTLTSVPAPRGQSELVFYLLLPAGQKPASGWPVALYIHGFESDMFSSRAYAQRLAQQGLAIVAINAAGQGGGPEGTFVVNLRNASGSLIPIGLPAGGRGRDFNGDGTIGASEGFNATTGLIGGRDGLRQTVVDLMQLVRLIELGMDVDGDGSPDLDPSRISYLGHSQGANAGFLLMALDSSVRAGALASPGFNEMFSRLSFNRARTEASYGARIPSLLNADCVGGVCTEMNENLPLRDEPPRVNTVEGAMAIQTQFERREWVRHSGLPDGYARHLRRKPLAGTTPGQVLVLLGRGDQDTPNPGQSLLIRTGDLADRTTYFRNDLAFAADPGIAKDSHLFTARPGSITNGVPNALATQAITRAAQRQIAVFLATAGATVLDPDGLLPQERAFLGLPADFPQVFEVPIASPLPEDLGYIPCSSGQTPAKPCL